MVVAPIIGALPGILVSHAVAPGTQLTAVPTKIVKGQDVLLTVQQQSGSFTPGATLYIKFSNNNNWGTGDGDAWLGLEPGQTMLPEGAIVYIPNDYSDSAIKGSDYLTAGEAYLLVSDSANGASGVVGPKLQVEDWGGRYPWIGELDPSYYVGISYSSSSLPQFRVLHTGARTVSPGQTITVKYFIPGNSVTIYWDYYGGQVLATVDGGKGKARFTIPDAPEGFHRILAVSDEGYGAFMWVYVQPSLSPDKFSIQGVIGETVTFTGKGFPANAKIDTHTPVVLIVNDGHATGTMRARIVSGGQVDENGNVEFTIELLDNKPAGMSGGIIDVRVTYSSGDVDYIVGGTFGMEEYAPAGDGVDTIKSVMAISTPSAYGDEFMVVFDPYNPSLVLPAGSTINRYVGQAFKVAVIDFPANTEVKIYVGGRVAGVLTTDDKGAAVGYVKTPTIPGYDNNADQIHYTIRAEATDPNTGGTLVGVGVNNNPYTLLIDYSVDIEWSPDGYGPDGDYLVSGLHTISVYIDGLSPYAKVKVEELMRSYVFNIAGVKLYKLYEVQTINGTLEPGYFVAASNGVLYVKYKVIYADLLDMYRISWSTGDSVRVQVTLKTTTGHTIAPSTTYITYYMIQTAGGRIQSVISSPASITPRIETAGPYQVVHPGDFIQVVFTGLVPNEAYTVLFNGMAVQLYDTSNRLVDYLWSDSSGTLVARIKLPNDGSVVGLDILTANYYSGVAEGKVAGVLKFIVSSPRADLYGGAKVFVDPNITVPGATINVIGVNFEAGESLKGGFSTIGTVATGRANNHGAVVFRINVPTNIPAGTYAAYIMRTVTYETFPTTIKVVATITSPSSSVLFKASGDTVTITVIGLEPNTAFMVKWSPTESELGEPLTDTGVPGVGTPLTWFSDSDGELTVTFEVPFGVIGEDYYATIVPANNPDTPVVPSIEIIITPGHGFELYEMPYVIAGQALTVYADPTLISSLQFPVNLSGAGLDEKVAFLANYGKVVAKLTLPDGTEDILPAAVSYEDGMIVLTFKMPNMQDPGVIGVEYNFMLAAPSVIDNRTNPYTVNYTVSETGWLTLGGIKAVKGGGILLANVEGQLATIVDAVNSTVQVLVKKVDDLNMTITDIADGVATIQTDIGTLKADVQALKQLLHDMNVTLVTKGDQIVAKISTEAGNINASLTALKKALEQGLGNIKSLAGISDTLSTINNKLDQALSALAQVQGNTADIKGSIVTVNNNIATVKKAVSDNSAKLDTVDKHVTGLGGKVTVTLLLDALILILAIIIVALQLKKAP